MNSRLFQFFIFISLFLALCFYFDYPHIATLPPQGQHAWRQTDGASQALNYYQFGLDFLKPEVHNIVLNGGAHAGEFPILYYISAILMHFLGSDALVIRFVHIGIFAIGLWFLFKILRGISGNTFFAAAGSLLFFSLPVVVFYAFNFLPNAPALGLVFVAWWYFYEFYKHQKRLDLYISMLFIALSGLLKPTMLISFCVILAIWLTDILRGKHRRSVFKNPLKESWFFLIVIIPILLWRLWADRHSNPELFLNTIMPIWKASPEQNAWTWTWLYDFWFKKITFSQPTFLFLSAIVALMLIFIKKFPFWIVLSWFLMLLGVLSVGALFFQQFSVHDYYAIDFLVFPAFTIIILAMVIKQCHIKIKGAKKIEWGITAILFCLLMFNTAHSKKDLVDRYGFNDSYLNVENRSLYKTHELHNFLKNLGISPQDTVLSPFDPSPNTTLFYLNLKGFTLWNNKVKICQDAQSKLPEPACVEYLIKNKNCKYLIISDLKNENIKMLQPFMSADKLLGVFDNSIYIYRLK